MSPAPVYLSDSVSVPVAVTVTHDMSVPLAPVSQLSDLLTLVNKEAYKLDRGGVQMLYFMAAFYRSLEMYAIGIDETTTCF